MPYLSQLLQRTVLDPGGRRVGRVVDLVTPVEEPYPCVNAVLVKGPQGVRRAEWQEVATLDELGARLLTPYAKLPRFVERRSELELRRDLLDRQIVDTEGIRVVRVNDVQLTRLDGELRLSGVDVGSSGLLRRLGLERLARRLVPGLKENVIPWDVVEPLDIKNQSRLTLTVPRRKIQALHPADLADLLMDLQGRERARFFGRLPAETAAEALQHLDEDLQAPLLTALSEERGADVLEEMDPDEAADLLAHLAPERARRLLERMEREEAEEVQTLMAYREESAGGLMTPEAVALPQDLSAQQAIERLRELAPDAETIYYLYVVDAGGRLAGVVSLRDLIVAPPETPLQKISRREVIKVRAEAHLREVAELIDRYNFLALPVVDAEDRIQGIVTVDDVFERVLPRSWRRYRRIRRRGG